MGLLKAGVGAAGGVLADQWREYFYCEALDADTLVAKGEKRVGKRGSNTKGENNVISDGSIVAVADGQCMMIVENGAVVDVCAEPGEFVYDTGTEPSRGRWQGSAHLLLQHQGDRRQQVRHRKPCAVSRGRRENRFGCRHHRAL